MNNKLQTILVLGAGFGGLRCAIDLHDRLKQDENVQIILVDKYPYQSFHAALYEVAAAHMPKEAICLPIRKAIGNRNIRFYQDIVEQLDPMRQEVTLHRQGTVRYDYLVLALGCVPNDYHIPGLGDHAHQFYTFENALSVRRHVEATLRTQENVRVVIGGGGPTGTELAAAFRYFASDFCKHRGRHQQHLHVDLIELSGHLLTGMPSKMAHAADKYLKRLGVHAYYNAGIAKVRSRSLTLTDGNTIPYDILIWTGGIKTNPVVQSAADVLPLDPRGRIVITKYLQAKGFSRIYAIGDIASFATGKHQSLPQVAPHAIWQGGHVARNIIKQLHDEHPIAYDPSSFPTVIPLGGEYGILRWHNRIFTGRWTLWAKKYFEWVYLSESLPFLAAWKMAINGEHHRHTVDYIDPAA